MAISNNSTGLRTGVCTSSTRPTAPYEGQMIYETNTDLTYIYNGSSWQQVAGSTAVGNSGLVYISSTTIGTGVSSVTVSNAFSATYENYLVTVTGGVASGNVSLDMTFGSTTTGYKWCLVYTAWGSTIYSDADAAAAKIRYVGRGETNSLAGHIEIMAPFLSKNTRVLASSICNADTGTSYGMLFDSTSYTAFNIVLNTGTMTGGTITVYGYRK
jgi:hypothetical protein